MPEGIRANVSIKKKLFVKHLFFFMALSVLFTAMVLVIREQRISEHLNAEQEMAATVFKITVDALKAQSDIVFYNQVQIPAITTLYREAEKASPKRRSEIREALYAKLLPVFENIQLNHLKQLHFHLKNNDSFLRFHRPGKFGDNLSDVRSTVAYVNRTQQPVKGFEEGRIFNGYRFVYPLFDGTEHIGSVELSVSVKTILEKFKEAMGADVDFMIREGVVREKVFENEQKNYLPSALFKGFMNEKAILPFRNPQTNRLISKYLGNREDGQERILKDETYSFIEELGGAFHIVTFLPLENVVSNETVGYIVLDRKHTDLRYVAVQPGVLIVSGIALLALLFYLLYRSEDQKQRIESERYRLHSLLELQKNIVILTDGRQIEYANKLFFDALGYDTLTTFLAKHECICKLFIEDERYFHLGKVEEGQNWLEVLRRLPATQRIVAIADAKGDVRIFTVAVSHVDVHGYIAAFTDISLTMDQQSKLEEKASHDRLTGAYNREFVETNLTAIEHAAKGKGKKLGIVMMDIDHFKRVNDTFGHACGDDVLMRFAKIIRETVRQEDHLVRWGGEEFLLLTMVDSKENVSRIAENVRHRISAEDFPQVGQVTASFGIACHCEGSGFDETIKKADKALYEAKEKGRNCLAFGRAC
jgi:diguanylate cyclase (GGDEF)-like protein